MRSTPFVFILAMFLLSIFSNASAQNFEEGQVWSYQARKGEEASRVLINKVETHAKLGKIFHISISGVKVKNQQAPGGITTDLSHFPVSQETLKKSVLKLEGKSKPSPAYQEAYHIWKNAFDKGEAGIFTIGVADIVGVVEKSINQPLSIFLINEVVLCSAHLNAKNIRLYRHCFSHPTLG